MHEWKPATSHDEQLQKLKDKGLLISDDDFCKSVIASVNYYRLKGYSLPFRKSDKNYRSGTTFTRIYRIYEFDRKLRMLFFSMIEQIEIYLRAKIAYYHAHQYGPRGYLDEHNFSPHHRHEDFIQKINSAKWQHRKSPVVKHYQSNYDGILPIWVVSELFTFGMLSRFYADMTTVDKKKLSSELYHTVPQNLESWLRCATDIRNICAHYGRLYYRIFPAVPAGLNLSRQQEHRLWGAIKTLRVLYPDVSKWNTEILPSLEALFDEYDDAIDLYHIAFPSDWRDRLIWSPALR